MVSDGVTTLRARRVDMVLGGVRPDFSSPPQIFLEHNKCISVILTHHSKYWLRKFKNP